MKALIRFELKAGFGFFKKPDANQGLMTTYNMIHKPALLGTLGAIAGLRGYEVPGQFPEYYEKLKHIRLSVAPVVSKEVAGTGMPRLNFDKSLLTFNNSTGLASKEEGGNWSIHEQLLIDPSYLVYVELDREQEFEDVLYDRLLSREADFIPYLGKNEHQAWWEQAEELEYEPFLPETSYTISSLFRPDDKSLHEIIEDDGDGLGFGLLDSDEDAGAEEYLYFERLPTGFDENLPAYRLETHVLTNKSIQSDAGISDLYQATDRQGRSDVIQLF